MAIFYIQIQVILHGTVARSNIYVYYYYVPEPTEPTSPVKTVDDSSTTVGDTVTYIVTFNVSDATDMLEAGVTYYYNSLIFTDELPTGLEYSSLRVADNSGTDITSSAGTVSTSGQTVIYTFDEDYLQNTMSYTGETYTFTITATVTSSITSATLTNIANVSIEDNLDYTYDLDSDEVETEVETQYVYTHYIDYYTNTSISETTYTEGYVGDTYLTTSLDLSEYDYTLYTDSGNTTGTRTADDINVYYYYKANSTITVYYVDGETGDVWDTEIITGLQGDEYETEAKKYQGYVVDYTEGETSGEMEAGSTTVTYYYKEAGVTVYYKDYYTDDTLDITSIDGEEGDSYTTEQKDIDGYTFYYVEGETSGTFTDDTIEVTYYYKKNTEVIVTYINYYDEEDVLDTITYSGLEGDEYSSDSKDITGYTLIEDSGNTEGTMEADTIYVYYYYAKNSTITVKYLDYANNEIIADTETFDGYEGLAYETEQKDIDGYTFYYVEGETSGTFTDEDLEIIYYYKYNSKLTVKYVDYYSGEELDEEILDDLEGEEVTTTPKDIDGYTLIQEPEEDTYTLEKENDIVYYYYAVNTEVVVNYIDKADNSVLDTETISGYEGLAYETEQKTISGYTFVSDSDNTSGYMESTTIYVYYYYLYNTSLTVKHVDYYSGEVLDTDVYEGLETDTITVTSKTITNYKLVESPDTDTYTLEKTNDTVYYYYVQVARRSISKLCRYY